MKAIFNIGHDLTSHYSAKPNTINYELEKYQNPDAN
jgi:hypothetical protein